MVEFDQGLGRFNYRVAGVALHKGKVLLDRNMKNNYWVLPGGHPEMMESMSDALRRELLEEIGAEVEVVRLLWIIENFFQKSKPIHELSFYFLVHLPSNSPLLASDGPFYGEEHDHRLVFQWHPLDESALSALPLYPGFLASALKAIPASPQHVIFEDVKRKHAHPKNEHSQALMDKENSISAFPPQ